MMNEENRLKLPVYSYKAVLLQYARANVETS